MFEGGKSGTAVHALTKLHSPSLFCYFDMLQKIWVRENKRTSCWIPAATIIFFSVLLLLTKILTPAELVGKMNIINE